MAQLTHCVCGADGGEPYEHAGLALLRCECGTARLAGELSGIEQLYRTGDYHRSTTRHPGCTPYAQRYARDLAVAATRWERYRAVLGDRLDGIDTALDVGCANGAFVDYLRSVRIDALGIEPAPEFGREHVMTGMLVDLLTDEALVSFGRVVRSVDMITFHDVLEHLVDPAQELERAARLLAPRGVLIVDVPDVWHGAGDHHYKDEHLHYFSERSLGDLLRRTGLAVIGRDQPIPGKLVLYGERR